MSITGAAVTVTFWVAAAELPEPSVAVHVTMVSPSPNLAGALFVITGDEPLLSVAVAMPIFTVIGSTAAASTETSAGTVITGGVLSVTGALTSIGIIAKFVIRLDFWAT